jgi:hypothetical protein
MTLNCQSRLNRGRKHGATALDLQQIDYPKILESQDTMYLVVIESVDFTQQLELVECFCGVIHFVAAPLAHIIARLAV